MSAAEIADGLTLQGSDRKRLQKWLNQMVLDGEIVRIRQNRYSLGRDVDLLTGDLTVVRSGNGFVKAGDGRPDVFVPERHMGTALPGDRVVVRVADNEQGDALRPEGKIIRILQRSDRDIVGTLKTTGKFLYVLPLDPVYAKDFYVHDTGGAQEGDRVVIKFTQWQNRHVNPEGRIVEVLGPATEPSVDTKSIIRHYGLSEAFNPDLLADADQARCYMQTPGERLDLRGRLIITIDPERARDFDDAVSLETDANGNRVLGVHIADVSHFVRPGGRLDTEARERGNSVYLPDAVLPMLPEQLSNGICSLRPDEDRLAFSVFLTFNERMDVVGRKFAKSMIRSKCRLTYEQAMDVIAGREVRAARDTAIVTLIRDLNQVAQALRKRRFARHALDLDVGECEIVIGPDGRMTGIRPVVNDESHQLIEECMVAANEAVAFALQNQGRTIISRLHEPPAPAKIEELTMQLAEMGYTPGDLNQPSHMAAFLRSIQDDPLGHTVRVMVLKSMSRAVYSADDSGHFGLAKKHYAHFTSPIRRYPDLVLHRQLADWLARDRNSYTKASLAAVAEHCSTTEQKAEEAEWALLEIKKYRYFEQELAEGKPNVYEAVICTVTNFGMFVELPDIQIQGLVHISAISGRYVRYDRRKQALRAGKKVYGIGDRVTVMPSSVDFDQRRLDFVLA